MIIQELSDLHFEHHRDQGLSLVSSLDPSGVDVLILAGDIYPWALASERETLRRLCALYPKVVYVPGNHEYYGFDLDQRFDYKANLLRDIPNLYMPHDVPLVIDGVRFCCTTLWFKESPDDILYADEYSDFDSIRGYKPWVYEQNRKAVDFLTQEVRKDDLVVTHFLPTHESVAPRYRGDRLNRFFVCDLSWLIVDRQPGMWFHGHSHAGVDYTIGPTRIYANPLGYPREPNVGFRDSARIVWP